MHDELATEFARDGAVCARGVVSPGLLARVATDIDANLAVPSELAQVASGADDPGRLCQARRTAVEMQSANGSRCDLPSTGACVDSRLMSYQMPPNGGPPRSTPIPGQSTPIPGTGPGGPAQFHGVPTAGAFLGAQGLEEPPPVKVRKDRNWGFWFFVLIIIVVPIVIGIGAAIWAVVKTKDAVDTANDKINEITIPTFPGISIPASTGGGIGDDGTPVVSLLLNGGPAATVAALDAGIPGDPTNFVEIILYPEYSFATAQDPTKPDHLDRYLLRSGSLDAPDPQSNDADAPSKVFTIDAVDWAAIAALAAEAPRLAVVEEGEVTHIIITRDVFTEVHDVVVRIYISGPRGSAFIETTPDGTVIRIL